MNCQLLNKVYWGDWLKIIIINKVMSRNKHMKIVADAATLTGIAAGIGKTSKRVNDFWSESYFHELCEVHRSCLSFSCNKILSWRLWHFAKLSKTVGGFTTIVLMFGVFCFLSEGVSFFFNDMEERLKEEFYTTIVD